MQHVVIIQNTTLAENYGLSTYIRNVVKELARNKDLKLSLICTAGKLNKNSCPTNVDLYEVSVNPYSLKGNARFFLQSFKLLRQINRSSKISTLHCLYPNSSVAAAVLFKLSVIQKINLIYDLRSPWVHISIERGSVSKRIAPLYRRCAYLTESMLSIFVDRFIFITEGLFGFYKNKLFLWRKPVAIIPSGIDTNAFSPATNYTLRDQLGLSRDDVVLGYVGVVSSLRKLSEVIETFALLHASKKYKLVIVGDGDDLNNLKRLVQEYKLGKHVVFTGKVPYDEINQFISCFDIGVCHLPDTFVFRQSYPMKVLEYLAAGLPVFASDIKAHRDISKSIKNITLYKNQDGLADALLTYSRTKKTVPSNINNYDWRTVVGSIIQAY